MVPTTEVLSEGVAETTLPDACVVCGGDVQLRVTHGHAKSYCTTCHWVGAPLLKVNHDGLHVSFQTQASA